MDAAKPWMFQWELFYHEEDFYIYRDNEGGANMPIGRITKGMFLTAAELEDLSCYEKEEDQEMDDIMWVLPQLLEWLERIRPSSGYKEPA